MSIVALSLAVKAVASSASPKLPTRLPGEMPVTPATTRSCPLPSYARAPLGPTQIAIGTSDVATSSTSAAMSSSSITAFLLLSWMTSAWTSWLSARSIAFSMKSAWTGSSRPVTSITLIGGTFAASCARAGCAKRRVLAATRAPRAAHTLDSLRNRASEGGWLDPLAFFATSRLVIVAGKGGVGKTTVTAALAVGAAKSGLRVLVVEVEGKSALARLFDLGALQYDEITVLEGAGAAGSGSVVARSITPTDALLEYLVDHGMRRLSNRLVRGGALDVVATAAPGIEDILVLGKVKQLERGGAVDLILLDAPAAGHAITFLESARGLLDAVTVGPDQQPSARRDGDADRPGALLGGARHAAGGDAGQRAGRHRLLTRGSRRRSAWGQCSSTASIPSAPAWTPIPRRPPKWPVSL